MFGGLNVILVGLASTLVPRNGDIGATSFE
jgi:hypothetical protein